MKKLVLLFCIYLVTSCEKSNEEDNYNDTLIGTWSIVVREGEVLDDCEKKSTIIFRENNTFNLTAFFIENSICISEQLSGKWENVGNSRYSLKPNDDDTATVSTIIFSNNNNRFTVKEEGETWQRN